MDIDEQLRECARRHLLGATMAADREQLEQFLHSAAFHTFAGGFHRMLEKQMQDFTAQPHDTPPELPAQLPAAAPAPDEPIPLPLKDLALPDAPAPAVEPPQLPAAPVLPGVTFRLPNARAGDDYRQRLEAIPATADSVEFCELNHPAGLTLGVDKMTGIVTGTFATPGDYPLTVVYRFASEPEHLRRTSLTVTVLPDPKKMWQDVPTQPDAPYWKADTDCAALADANFRIVAASKRGRSHAHVGSFRDDDFRIAQVAGVDGANWQVAVLADGAGSARYSRQGAAIICAQALSRLEAALQGERGVLVDDAVKAYQQERGADEDQAALALRAVLSTVVGNAAYYAAKGIMDECAAMKDSLQTVPRDYASTALIAICKHYDFGTLSAAYWVGDGAIGVYSAQDGVHLLGDVDSGEFSGQTRFLEGAEVTQDALLRRTRFVVSPHLTALVLMTDGVSDPRFETDARLSRPADWDALWHELDDTLQLAAPAPAPGTEQRLLDWLDFWSPGNHDDRTIAIVTPTKAADV
jgi:hypothetical protein